MTESYAPPIFEVVGPTSGALLRRRIFTHKGLLIGLTLLAIVLLMALLAPLIAPHDPYAQDLTRRTIPPLWSEKGTWAHVLGTDNLGRDYLSRVIYGARISLLIGFAVMVISGLIGAALGLAAGYFGGRTDMVVTFFITIRLAMPVILVALAVGRGAGARPVEVGSLRGRHARRDSAGALSRLRDGRRRDRRFHSAHHRRRGAAQRVAAADRGGERGGGERYPARSRIVVPRPRRAAAAAILGTHDRGGQGLYVLLVLADRHSGHRAGAARARHQHGGRRHPRRQRALGEE